MSDIQRIPFMKLRKITFVASIALLIISALSLGFKGLNFGLDFTGGTLIQVAYEQPADVSVIREQLQQAGFKDVVVQYFGSNTDVLMRLQVSESATLGDEVMVALRSADAAVTLSRSEFVGPTVGEELRESGGLAMVLALIIVMIYIALRFQFKFSIGAVGALIHDVIIVLGFFSVTGFDFDLTVLAAVLAVIGYSLNDTIVVSDRIRENFRNIRSDDIEYIIDVSLTQTLGRTLMTSATTLIVLLSLLLVGGELNFGFAVALISGVFVGTYSSIYVAANILMAMELSKEDLMQVEKPKDDVDEVPSWLQD